MSAGAVQRPAIRPAASSTWSGPPSLPAHHPEHWRSARAPSAPALFRPGLVLAGGSGPGHAVAAGDEGPRGGRRPPTASRSLCGPGLSSVSLSRLPAGHQQTPSGGWLRPAWGCVSAAVTSLLPSCLGFSAGSLTDTAKASLGLPGPLEAGGCGTSGASCQVDRGLQQPGAWLLACSPVLAPKAPRGADWVCCGDLGRGA